MQILEERTVGEIVAEDYRTAGVFRKHGIDFCCGGGKPIAEVCRRKGVEMNMLLQELSEIMEESTKDHNYITWPLGLLIDYIVQRHHSFVRSKLPEIRGYAEKVAKVHGRSHQELITIFEEFDMLSDELSDHLEKEEQLLFPYIKKLVDVEAKNELFETPKFGTASNPVAMMEAEHEEAGRAMAKIQRLSNNFTPPEDACATYRVLFQNLKGFQDDLHKHVHLENNILFPRALELEKRLN